LGRGKGIRRLVPFFSPRREEEGKKKEETGSGRWVHRGREGEGKTFRRIAPHFPCQGEGEEKGKGTALSSFLFSRPGEEKKGEEKGEGLWRYMRKTGLESHFYLFSGPGGKKEVSPGSTGGGRGRGLLYPISSLIGGRKEGGEEKKKKAWSVTGRERVKTSNSLHLRLKGERRGGKKEAIRFARAAEKEKKTHWSLNCRFVIHTGDFRKGGGGRHCGKSRRRGFLSSFRSRRKRRGRVIVSTEGLVRHPLFPPLTR